jgi:hypothetical protein
MLRLVARYADWWNIGTSKSETYAHKLDVLRKHCDDVGRDYATIVKTVQIEIPPPTDAVSTRQTVDRLREYVDLGASHLMLDFGVVTDPAVVRRIGEDVLAQFK